MDIKELISNSSTHLDRVLAFFPRVETKATALFAVNIAMLGVVAVNIKFVDLFIIPIIALAVVTAILLCVSTWFVYLAFFPDFDGDESTSVLYFRAVKKMSKENFFRHMKAMSPEQYVDDFLDQIWRNSAILTRKFSYIKKAFIFTALSLPFWFVFLLFATVFHSQVVLK